MEYERGGDKAIAEGRTHFDDETERDDEREPRVQVLTPSERNAYQGVTIDEGAPEDGEGRTNLRFERKANGWNQFSYMTNGSSWQNKALLLLVTVTLLFFILFIALPVAFTMLLIGMVSWLLYRLFL